MSLLSEVLEYNKVFIHEKLYEEYTTTKFPDKKLVILTCMDTRLVELLHKAMNMKNGDVKVVKNAGAILTHRFGSIMRSLLIAIYELKADEVYVIGHHDCGMSVIESEQVIANMIQRGVPQNTIDVIQKSGINLGKWLEGFDTVEESVAHSVSMIRDHPLMADEVPVHGLVIDPVTGELDLVVNGYKNIK